MEPSDIAATPSSPAPSEECDASALFKTREAALAADGDVRIHYKGGVYRALFTAVCLKAFAAGQVITIQTPPTDVVKAAEPRYDAYDGIGKGCAAVRLAQLEANTPNDVQIALTATVTDGTELGETLTIYEHMYPRAHRYYARPIRLFEGSLPDDGPAPGGPRFARVK